jgi:hypothetical protein
MLLVLFSRMILTAVGLGMIYMTIPRPRSNAEPAKAEQIVVVGQPGRPLFWRGITCRAEKLFL